MVKFCWIFSILLKTDICSSIKCEITILRKYYGNYASYAPASVGSKLLINWRKIEGFSKGFIISRVFLKLHFQFFIPSSAPGMQRSLQVMVQFCGRQTMSGQIDKKLHEALWWRFPKVLEESFKERWNLFWFFLLLYTNYLRSWPY